MNIKEKKLFTPLIFFLISIAILTIRVVSQRTSIRGTPVDMRPASELGQEEYTFLAHRHPIIRQHVQALIGHDIPYNKVPTIAFCGSGGGFRAMYAMLGLLEGAQDIGLLDAVTYISCLSGSTWVTLPWLAQNKPLSLFKQELLAAGRRGFLHTSGDVFREITRLTKERITKGKSFDVIDGYASFLTKRLFTKETREHARKPLSSLGENPYAFTKPLPIATAVYQGSNHDYQWVEFTPYDVGSTHLGVSIPSAKLGSHIVAGMLAKELPQPSLAYLLGIFGSAFSMSIRDIVDQTPHRIRFLEGLQNAGWYNRMKIATQRSHFANHKFNAARLPNFTYQLAGTPLANKKFLTLTDGGYIHDLPLEPLLKPARKVDIIFVLDCYREKQPKAQMLALAKHDAQTRGLPFPPIDYEQATTKPLSIFSDPNDPTCPTIVYIPLRKNPGYTPSFNPATASHCATLNFTYTKAQAERLSGLIAHVLRTHRNEIVSLLADCIAKK